MSLNFDDYETVPATASLTSVLKQHADGYTSSKGKIIKRECYVDTMRGTVVVLLTVDKSKPSDTVSA